MTHDTKVRKKTPLPRQLVHVTRIRSRCHRGININIQRHDLTHLSIRPQLGPTAVGLHVARPTRNAIRVFASDLHDSRNTLRKRFARSSVVQKGNVGIPYETISNYRRNTVPCNDTLFYST